MYKEKSNSKNPVRNFVHFIVRKTIGWFGYKLPSFEHNPEAEQAALNAARDWLALIDQQKWDQSWEDSAPKFKKVVSKDEWELKSRGVREPLGALLKRNDRSSKYATSMP